jgi:pSer/pThr/pTyr-binding forkhead associated (FHA) protein
MELMWAMNDNIRLYLKPFHRFGRLFDSVDTFIEHPEISRIHTIIEWVDAIWFIRDISKNGIWLNGERIIPNKPYQLNIKDKVKFSNVSGIEFEVLNLDEPQDVLVPYNRKTKQTNPTDKVVFLGQYNLLPSESEPEIAIFYDGDEKNWCCESVSDMSVRRIADGDCVKFSDSMWQLLKGADQGSIQTAQSILKSEQDLTFVFNISQDEELTELTLQNNSSNISCDTRSHHYLTALLARYRSQDCHKSLPEHLQGWRTIEQLTKDIGLSESHVNIQIHRARKQLSDKLKILGLFSPLLIERKKGQVRFAATDYKIFKGQTLEEDSMCLQPS